MRPVCDAPAPLARKMKKAGPCRANSAAPVAAPARERAAKATVTLRAALICRFFVLPVARVSGFVRLGLTPGLVAGALAGLVAGFVASLAAGSVASGVAASPAAGWVVGFAGGSAVGFAAG